MNSPLLNLSVILAVGAGDEDIGGGEAPEMELAAFMDAQFGAGDESDEQPTVPVYTAVDTKPEENLEKKKTRRKKFKKKKKSGKKKKLLREAPLKKQIKFRQCPN